MAEDPEDAIAVRFADQPKRVSLQSPCETCILSDVHLVFYPAVLQVLPHPLIIRPLAKAEYFEVRMLTLLHVCPAHSSICIFDDLYSSIS